ncbi:MAG: hypothetical protein C0467_27135 [Planctomycetaceae bacterium]|nr:hypothetical protein [Planctomycetaceae bacterium]
MPDRVTMQIPVVELWDESGALPLMRQRHLGHSDIAALLRQGPIRFVVVNCGERLDWIPLQDCYDLWKHEVQPRLVEPDAFSSGFRLENFPGGYCYVASEWGEDEPVPIVVLEMYH